jgi:hypothetical protein
MAEFVSLGSSQTPDHYDLIFEYAPYTIKDVFSQRRLREGEILHIHNALIKVGTYFEDNFEHFPKIEKSSILLYGNEIKFINPYISENYTKTVISYYLKPTNESKALNVNMIRNNVKQLGIMMLSLASGIGEDQLNTQEALRQSLEVQRPYYSKKLLAIIETACISANPPTFKELEEISKSLDQYQTIGLGGRSSLYSSSSSSNQNQSVGIKSANRISLVNNRNKN